jgi:hypothetical protein
MREIIVAILVAQTAAGADAGIAGVDAGIVRVDAGIVAGDAGVDAGIEYIPFNDEVYSVCPVAPPSERVDGGYFLPEMRAARNACLMATCDRALFDERHPDQQKPPPGWVGYVLVGAGVVFGIGFVVGKYVPK